MQVIAVANQKGGVGKTTIAREVSACCALRGYSVLVIDNDPQGNLTQSWVSPEIYEVTLAHVLVEPERAAGNRPELLSLTDALVETPVVGLELVPADIRLAKFDQQSDYMTHRLRQQIHEHGVGYDLIFIDCPPQLGRLLTSALYAAQHVLVPCSSDPMGLQGLADLSFTVARIRANVNAELRMLGAVMNLFKPNRNMSGESRLAIGEVEASIGHLFDTNIHDYSKIAEAPSQQLPVQLYAPSHRAADQFAALTDEVLDRLRMPRHKIAAVK